MNNTFDEMLNEYECLEIIIERCLSQNIYYKNGKQKPNTISIDEALQLFNDHKEELKQSGVIF